MLYSIEYAVANFINKIELTFQGFWSAVGSVHYSFGEFIYDLRSIWN